MLLVLFNEFFSRFVGLGLQRSLLELSVIVSTKRNHQFKFILLVVHLFLIVFIELEKMAHDLVVVARVIEIVFSNYGVLDDELK